MGYRIPTPGAKIQDGSLYANIGFPGLEIRYTLDNSEPTINSALYTEPIQVLGKAKLKTLIPLVAPVAQLKYNNFEFFLKFNIRYIV